MCTAYLLEWDLVRVCDADPSEVQRKARDRIGSASTRTVVSIATVTGIEKRGLACGP